MDENGKEINLSSDHEVQTDGEGWPCAGDKLERHKEIENLSTILLNARAPLVVAIDSPWGGGKTTFIKLWQHYLGSEREQESLYLNAWENDYVSDPLLPLLAQLNRWLSKKSIGKKVLRNLEKTAMKILKAGLVEQAGRIRFVGWFAKIVLKTLIDQYMKNPDSMSDFRQSLTDCLACVPGDQNLIVFVDELDRCNPLYAIAMLERIKHLFSVDRLIFVFAINSDQLCESIKGVYGSEFDAECYLKRFINLDYQLKEPGLESFVEYQFVRYGVRDVLERRKARQKSTKEVEHMIWSQEEQKIASDIVPAMMIVVNHMNYSLRDINQLVAKIGLIIPSIRSTDIGLNIVLLICLLVLRDQDIDLYRKYANSQGAANEVIKRLTGIDFEHGMFPKGFGVVAGSLLQVPHTSEGHQQDMWLRVHEWMRECLNSAAEPGELNEEIERLQEYAYNERNNREDWQAVFERVELLSVIKV